MIYILNDCLLYVFANSNDSPTILKQLPLMVDTCLSSLPLNEDKLDKVKPLNENTLKISCFNKKLKFESIQSKQILIKQF